LLRDRDQWSSGEMQRGSITQSVSHAVHVVPIRRGEIVACASVVQTIF
jgi:hypothetical protein